MTEHESRRLGEATRAAHPPEPPPLTQRPLGLAVHRTAAFAFADAQEYADLVAGTRPGYNYSRADSPTADAFAAAVRALEAPGGGDEVAAQAFGSGAAAMAGVLLALGAAGRHVVAPREIYGGSYGLLTGTLARFGLAADFVDGTDPQAVAAAAIRPGRTALVWAETLANPTMSVADLPALAAVAHEAELPLVVDSTFASPSVCRPLEHGADLVVHSATKYLGGHADATGGVVVGRAELVHAVREVRIEVGSQLAPDEAFLLHRGLLTLPLRMQRHCASALELATALAAHPKVSRVDYPGLPDHRDHQLARKLFEPDRFGAVITVTPQRRDREAGMALCDHLRVLLIATSLGGVHSKVSHVASTTHTQLPGELLAAAGIAPSAVRISVGLEDPADLVADLAGALDAL